MRTWRVKCLTGAVASGLAALVVAPSAMAGTNVQYLAHQFAAPPSTAYCEANFGIDVLRRGAVRDELRHARPVQGTGSPAPARRS